MTTFPVTTFTVRLKAARMLSPTVRELTFERIDGQPFQFEAGQWVNLTFDSAGASLTHAASAGASLTHAASAGAFKRAYSIASAPKMSPEFELAVTKVEGGPGSTRLHALREGDTLECTGPQGLFLRRLTGPTLFVGTGTGFTPLRSMLRNALASDESAPLWVLFGVRREEEMIYRDELLGFAAKHPNIRVEYTLSQGSEAWSGRRGYVQTHLRELWEEMAALGADGTEKPHVFICGLAKMITDVRDVLRKQMELPRQLVHSERYD